MARIFELVGPATVASKGSGSRRGSTRRRTTTAATTATRTGSASKLATTNTGSH
jgi:hypothetical protein